jgi:hypothetical protein
MDFRARQKAAYAGHVGSGMALLLLASLARSPAVMAQQGSEATDAAPVAVSVTQIDSDMSALFDGYSSPLLEAVDATTLALTTQSHLRTTFTDDSNTDVAPETITPRRSCCPGTVAVSSSGGGNGIGSHDPLTLSVTATLLLLLRYRDRD